MTVKVQSQVPAGEILDAVSDVFNEEAYATQIISVVREPDPINIEG